MARLMGLVDGEGEDEEDVELEETEEKEEENGKLSEEEAQDKFEPVSGGSAQQQGEEVACHTAVENTETVEVEDILTELWRWALPLRTCAGIRRTVIDHFYCWFT